MNYGLWIIYARIRSNLFSQLQISDYELRGLIDVASIPNNNRNIYLQKRLTKNDFDWFKRLF